jgi:hypothetical protein
LIEAVPVSSVKASRDKRVSRGYDFSRRQFMVRSAAGIA